MSPLILITGAAGRIGQAAVRELTARGHTLRGFDRVPAPGLADCIVGDITDPAACKKAMAGVSTLIHLAATPDDVDDSVKELFPPNIVGVYQVFEAAKTAGVKRFIVASSGQVVWGQRHAGQMPIGTEVQPTPRYWYAATKMFLESISRSYSDTHGIDVLVVRLGWCPRPGQEREIAETPWAHDVFLSPGDAGRFFACAVESRRAVRFAIVYAASLPVHRAPYDLGPARDLLGYEPCEQWPAGINLGLAK